MSPLLAQSGHPDTLNQCPLLGVKRTLVSRSAMSAFDPKRTYSLPAEHRLDSQNDLAPHVPRGHFIQGDCCLVQWERAANIWPQAAVVVPAEKHLNSWSH